MQGVEEAQGPCVGVPAFEDDAVAEHVVGAVLPGSSRGFGVVGLAVDVAGLVGAFGIGGGHGAHGGEGGGGGGGRDVGDENNLVVVADPA